MKKHTTSEFEPDSTARLIALVRDLNAELYPRLTTTVVTTDSVLDRDLGIDSLGRVELVTRIEQAFGVSLDEDVFGAAETVGDLLRTIHTANRQVVSAARMPRMATGGECQVVADKARTLLEVLDFHVMAHPDRPHVRLYSDQGDGEMITYRELDRDARRVAAGLQSHGVEPGHRVVIMLPTGREYFLSFLGILLAGAIPVPIYPPARSGQLDDHFRRHISILGNCEPTILITVAQAKSFARLLKAQVSALRHIVTPADLTNAGHGFEHPAVTADTVAFIQYTSGSTGDPKGVVLTHDNLLANIRADGERIEVTMRDVFVSWLPLYHDMGLIGAWLGSMYHAVPLIVMSPLAFLARPRRWLWAIHRHRGTLSAAPNFAYELCVTKIKDKDLEGLDLSSWRIAFNGAEAVSPDTITRFIDRFGRYGFEPQAMYPVYGLAESAVGLAFPPLKRPPIIDRVQRGRFMRSGRALPAPLDERDALRFVASGQPLRGHEIRIVDDNGREAPERQQGKLQFRGPSATRGYFRNTEATRALFDDDWLKSGDLAYMVGGDVYITGRTKDLIIRAGRNIYPQELEQALACIDGIRSGRVAVFGSDEPTTGTERLIVLAETHERDEEAREHLRQQIIDKTADLVQTPPDEIVLAPAGTVLKTSSGKLRRADMRALFEQGEIGRPRKTVRRQIAGLALAGIRPQLTRYARAVLGTAYAGYAWAAFCLFAALAWLSVAVLPYPTWRWRAIRCIARACARCTATPLTVRGAHDIPADGACILVANHASYLDSYVMAAVSPIPFSFVAKAELTTQPVLHWILQRIRTLFVERFDTQRAIADAAHITAVARSGRVILFFPEGTFSRSPGLLPFHMGAFMTAVQSNIPVVPVVIRGTRSILRAGSWFPRRGRIGVTIGAPIHPSKNGNSMENDWSAALRLRATVRDYMLRHCREPDLS